MRILFVANTLPPADVSGVGEQVMQLAAGLRERGHEVRVLGRGADGVRGPKLLFPLTVVPALSRELVRFRPDVVQVHEGDAGLAALRLRRARGAARRPLLVALQQVSYVEEQRAVRPIVFAGRVLGTPGPAERRFRRFKSPLQIALGRWTARCADVVLAPSAATARELERGYGASDPQVLPNVTSALFDPASAPLPEEGAVPFDGRFSVSGSDGYLLFVGRLRIRKGVEVLLEAMALLAKQPEARLLIAGDGEHRAALERRTAELGLGARVRFAGRVSAAEVRALLARAAALVVPSTYEGMPLVVLEAMAAAVPVVASRVSGIPEVVLDGETGWLVPPEDPPSLARTLEELRRDRAEAARRGAAGRARVDACYRPRHAAELWESIVARHIGERA
jgi:glycosyltransferase involved in cell wall biosynthesis